MEAYFQSEVSLPSVERKANLCSTCEHGFQITQWYEWIAKLSYCQMWNSSWNVMQMFFSFTRTFKCCSWTSCIFFLLKERHLWFWNAFWHLVMLEVIEGFIVGLIFSNYFNIIVTDWTSVTDRTWWYLNLGLFHVDTFLI